jgi:hypothetical protein
MRPARTPRALLVSALLLACAPVAARAGEARKESTSTYTQLDGLTATVLRSDGRRGVLSVQAGLDAPDPKLHALVAKSIPRLRDAYVQVMATYGAGLAPGAPPNPDMMSQQLQRATDRILGRPGARFLLGTVLVN